MYNAAQKEEFIREYSTKISVRTQAKNLFELFEPYEQKWQADLCTRSLDELQPVFDTISGVRESSRRAPRTILRKYALWCMERGVPGATDAVSRLDSASLGNLETRMLRSPRHLQSVLDVICAPESDETADNNIRTYYWLAYAGFRAEDIPKVRIQDVHLDDLTVRFGGREYPIYREALPAVRNCVKLTEFRYIHPLYPERVIWKDRIPGDVLVRGIRSVPSMNTMQVEIFRRIQKAKEAGKTDMQLSYYRIWLSGVFYRMLDDELAGFPVDFDAFVDDKLGDFQYSVKPGGNTQACKRHSLALTYQQDYERRKMTLL